MRRKKSLAISASLAFLLLSGCVAVRGPGYEAEVPPPLPAVVELGDEPYYYQSGYYYYYDDDRWLYSRDRRGPWVALPRERWPRDTHYRVYRYRGDEQRSRGNAEPYREERRVEPPYRGEERSRGSEERRGDQERVRGNEEHGRGNEEHGRGNEEHGRGNEEHGRSYEEHGRGYEEHGRGAEEH